MPFVRLKGFWEDFENSLNNQGSPVIGLQFVDTLKITEVRNKVNKELPDVDTLKQATNTSNTQKLYWHDSRGSKAKTIDKTAMQRWH